MRVLATSLFHPGVQSTALRPRRPQPEQLSTSNAVDLRAAALRGRELAGQGAQEMQGCLERGGGCCSPVVLVIAISRRVHILIKARLIVEVVVHGEGAVPIIPCPAAEHAAVLQCMLLHPAHVLEHIWEQTDLARSALHRNQRRFARALACGCWSTRDWGCALRTPVCPWCRCNS